MLNIFKAILKTGSASLINILSGMIVTKVIAVSLGTAGVGFFSILRQLLLTMGNIITMGGEAAVVQGIAAKEGDSRDRYIYTVVGLFVITSSITTLILLIFAPIFTSLIFNKDDADTINVIKWLALPTVLMGLSLLFSRILNGFREIGKVVIVQVTSPVIMMLIIFPVVRLVETGYVLAFIWLLSVSFFISLCVSFYFNYKNGYLRFLFKFIEHGLDKPSLIYFFNIAAITLVASLFGAVIILAIRALIVQYLGLQIAGIFDAAWTLSMTYILLILSSFMTFYMPTLAQIKDDSHRNIFVGQVFKLIVLLIIPLIVSIIFLKPLVIQILYSNDFIPAIDVMKWMLIGDYFKVTATILAMPILAYANMKMHLITTIIWYLSFFICTIMAVAVFHDLQIVGMGFLLLYIVFFIFYILYIKAKYLIRISNSHLYLWLSGSIIVLSASYMTWNDTVINWPVSVTWICIAVIFPFLMLNKDEKNKLSQLVKKLHNRK